MSAGTFSLRVRDIREQVTRVKDMLEAMAAAHDGLYQRVQGRLGELVRDSEKALGEVETLLDAGDDEVSEKLMEARRASTLLFRESFAFAEGALSRGARLDDGFCELADTLLDSLAKASKLNWGGMTILAETSFYGEAAEVIRLKYPELSIWHLPVAAHEFGHFATPEIRVKARKGSVWSWKYPVQAILEREERRDSRHWFHAHELFADIFAVYALGPSYAYSSLLLRLDPGARRTESPNHPSWDDRYFVIVETLRRVSSHGGVTQQIVEDVASRWADIRASEPDSKPPDTTRLQRMFNRFYPLLDKNLAGVRYATFARAQQLVPALADDKQALPPLDGFSVSDVLNAAWLARLDRLDDAKRTQVIEKRALAACRAI